MNSEAVPEKPRSEPAAAAPLLPKASRWPVALAMLALLAVVILLGIGHFYWQGMQLRFAQLRQVIDQASSQQQVLGAQMQERGRLFAEQQARLREQDELIRRQADTIASQQAKLAQEAERLARQEDTVRQTLKNIQQSLGHSGQAWRAAEAAYLVELARQRLVLQRDAPTALAALQSAVQRLRETGEPRWLPIGERLAHDIERLQAVKTIDRAALSAKLVDLASHVDGLVLRVQSAAASIEAPAQAPADSAERSLDSLWQHGLNGLKSLVQIRRHDGLGGIMLPGEDQHYQVRQNLRLQLDSARFGLLRADPELYASSLDTAKVWLETFFKRDSAETQRYLKVLDQLRGAEVDPPLPDISATLQALRALLEKEAGEA
jgi:uroporphyrin-3 C-methyltransferase